MKLKLKVKYLSEAAGKLCYVDGKSDWIDLRCTEDVTLAAGESRLLPLGVAIKLPEGYEAHIVPRSSTFKKYGIIQTNHMGVVDESYCGDGDQWFMPVYAVRDTSIEAGSRVCQFRVTEHQPTLEFEQCDTLGSPDRGGFGSTGSK